MKKCFMVFLLAMICLWGCGDEGIESTLQEIGAAPSAQIEITGVPSDIQEQLWGNREELVAELSEALQGGKEREGEAFRLLERICALNEAKKHYTKYIDADGIAIMGDRHVNDRHFYAAREMVLLITSERPELRETLSVSRDGFRMILYASEWSLASLPEVKSSFYPTLPGSGIAFCGSGAITPLKRFCVAPAWFHPVKTDEITGLRVFVHEFAHGIHHAINTYLDPTFQDRLEAAYTVALETGGYWGHDTYGLTNVYEYWAEGVTDWFYDVANPEIPFYRAKFLEKDPHLYALLDDFFSLIHLAPIEWKW